jgi:hypothetical protein
MVIFGQQDLSRSAPLMLNALPSRPDASQGSQERYFSYTIVPSHDAAGRVDGVIVYATDETEQHSQEIASDLEHVVAQEQVRKELERVYSLKEDALLQAMRDLRLPLARIQDNVPVLQASLLRRGEQRDGSATRLANDETNLISTLIQQLDVLKERITAMSDSLPLMVDT